MFVGHYAASFALRARGPDPRVPLWILFLAVQAVDIGWAILVMLGVERAQYVPNFTASFPLDLQYMPYTHSLVAAVLWAAACAALYAYGRKAGAMAGLAVGVAVLSHWFLDLPVHVKDLPLYGNQMKQGFGLWNHRVPELLVEVGLLLGAIALYARRNPRFARRAWIFGLVLAAIQAGQNLGPWLLTSAHAVAASALVSYLVFAFVAWRIERVRTG